MRGVDYILSISSTLFGLVLIMTRLHDHSFFYAIVNERQSLSVVGLGLIAFSIVKLIGTFSKKKMVNILALAGLSFIWFLILFAFLFVPPTSTIECYSFTMLLLCFWSAYHA